MQFTLHIANSNSFQSRNLEFESSPENNFVYQNCNKRVEIKSFHEKIILATCKKRICPAKIIEMIVIPQIFQITLIQRSLRTVN